MSHLDLLDIESIGGMAEPGLQCDGMKKGGFPSQIQCNITKIHLVSMDDAVLEILHSNIINWIDRAVLHTKQFFRQDWFGLYHHWVV